MTSGVTSLERFSGKSKPEFGVHRGMLERLQAA